MLSNKEHCKKFLFLEKDFIKNQKNQKRRSEIVPESKRIRTSIPKGVFEGYSKCETCNLQCELRNVADSSPSAMRLHFNFISKSEVNCIPIKCVGCKASIKIQKIQACAFNQMCFSISEK